eukprot:CAMPEP_0206044282 /NCGR_PEP_ID=MMETSP1466-20131121/12225_1 /ASSEMBLY_ACC=CAM_ASM_001126 /TAXON_ID=44452 /ORGANISM="Pavlova gyrans, Strain CCMP608" /LENGTH=623 /DNA_ID=CAMNT_0053419167 /DNA_START=69 /DNA_END=1937 /DNA_ORIENTATION=+
MPAPSLFWVRRLVGARTPQETDSTAVEEDQDRDDSASGPATPSGREPGVNGSNEVLSRVAELQRNSGSKAEASNASPPPSNASTRATESLERMNRTPNTNRVAGLAAEESASPSSTGSRAKEAADPVWLDKSKDESDDPADGDTSFPDGEPGASAVSGRSRFPTFNSLEASFRQLKRDRDRQEGGIVSLADLQLYQHACGHEGKFVPMVIERLYSWLGVKVARNPVRTIVLSLMLVVVCSSGLLYARFETEPEALYVPQFSEVGLQRKYVDFTFGARPQPGIFVVKAHNEGTNILTRDHMRALFELHDIIQTISVPWNGKALSFEDLCARRYFAQGQDYSCLSSSLLQLWYFHRSAFERDDNWQRTIARAYLRSEVDFGGTDFEHGPNGTFLVAEAMQVSYYFNASLKDYSDGGMNAWEDVLVREIATINAESRLISLSYWSSKLNEKDASSIVSKDVDVLCLTFIFILAYVCVTLGGFTLDRRKSRMALGAFCGICTGCSLSSGFGICAFLGVPLAPMSTLVLFTLIGVSVDDMIIIVDAFDRTSSQVSIDERVRLALSHAGTAVTMTSVTTMVAFLSGVNVDLPSIQLFCAPAAASVFMVNVLQVTLFTGLLVLDARRQAS